MDTLLLRTLVGLVAALLLAVLWLLFLQLRRPRAEQAAAPAALVAERLAQLGPVAQAIQGLQVGLAEVQAYARGRQQMEEQTARSIQRLEAVLAGAHSKGLAGERLLDSLLATLPAEWQLRNLRVGNKVVEFALRLPNGLALPIDSKWPASGLLEQLAACDDPYERQRLKARVEQVVLERARELRKYLDPDRTLGFGVAAVPDAVYELCAGAHAEALQLGVAIVSYGLFVPYLLLVFHLATKQARTVDLEQLGTTLQQTTDLVTALQAEVEGRLAKAIAMLANSRADLAAQLGQLHRRLSSVQQGQQNREALATGG